MTKYIHYQKYSYIKNSVWNNNFSYNQRILKWLAWYIYIPSVIYAEENPSEKIMLSDEVCFEEIDENNNIQSCYWLRNHILYKKNDKYIFIIDNHNHALYRRYWSYIHNIIQKWTDVIHVDQHADMWIPESQIDKNIYNLKNEDQLNYIYKYTNNICNVGNFIDPAIKIWLIWEIHQIRSWYKLEEIYKEVNDNHKLSQWFILDIDVDFWSEKIDKESINITKALIKKAKVITIATSPYFIDFKNAKKVIDMLLIN